MLNSVNAYARLSPSFLTEVSDNDDLISGVIEELHTLATSGEPWEVFGDELRTAGALLFRATACVKNDATQLKLRRLLMRPAIEPLLVSHWDRLFAPAPTIDGVLAFMGPATGAAVAVRRTEIYTEGAVGGRTYFAAVEGLAERYIESLVGLRSRVRNSLTRAIAEFALTIIVHPLEDGNGRLARALLSGGLGMCCGVKFTTLPLSPHIYIDLPEIVALHEKLGKGGAWSSYKAATCAILVRAIRRQRALSQIWSP